MNGSTTHNNTHLPSPAASSIDCWLLKALFRLVGRPAIGMELWDGSFVGDESSGICIHFHDRGALYRALYKPTYSFGLLYTARRITVTGDLTTALERIYSGLIPVEQQAGWLNRTARRVTAHRPNRNSLHGSKENIHAHYDLGNDFYRLWLDTRHTQYTCAYFPTPDAILEDAQTAKLELVCRKLALRPGERVVEAGGGWGGLARYLAKQHGVKVASYNISASQIAYARERARAEGLQDQIEYIEDDYRNIRGTFDAFVSVGMLEHVGPDNFAATGKTIERCLRDDGRGFIHTIGQISPRPLNEWIERNIFPGAEPPSLKQMMDIFEPHNLVIQDVENLRPHYALTLRHWLARFEAHADDIEQMFDPEFVRAWRLYLSGSAAAFSAGSLQLFQVLFQRPNCPILPHTRADRYSTPLVRLSQQSR